MLAIIVFIVILGVLIFVHEVGHFTAARRNGIKAKEFGFGFPPRIFGIQFLYEEGEKRKWRLIWGTRDGDDEKEKKDLGEIREKKIAGGTIYSLNWILLGGFVKIKGEDGKEKNDPDSFAGKSAWSRIKVLAAGVAMNFALAWVLISVVFMLGAPQAIDSTEENFSVSKIQISDVSADSPAEESGLQTGDEILKTQKNADGKEINLGNIKETQGYINDNSGREISLNIKRGDRILEMKITPRRQALEGQGLLGVSLVETAIIKYFWPVSLWEGLKTTLYLTGAILAALFGIIGNLITGNGLGADVAGPVGIAVLTREVAGLGFIYILQFAALLSINLGIINILPIPALDGGRILFVLIEKIKGSPVSQKIEQAFHSVGFILLIFLLILITFKDVWRFVK